MKNAILAIGKLCLYYSTNPVEFETYPKFKQTTKAMADKLVKTNFKKVSEHKYTYKSLETDTKFTIFTNSSRSFNKCSCNCKTYIKDGVCLHAVACSNIFT